MGRHAKLAEKAVAMGNTAVEFHAAAQSHANATWGLLIAAGVVWYFIDWKWALLPGAIGAYTALKSVSATMVATKLEKIDPTPAPGGGDDFMTIVQIYGKVLETEAPVPGMVADANKLPYPKQEIKGALVAALRTKPDQRLREHLKTAFILLSDWQDGVGDTNQGFDPSSVNENEDDKALATQVVAAIESGKKWTDAARQEREALKKELEELGLW